jgi:hypothetical protein
VVHINPLEFAAQIITYMMCIVVLQQAPYTTPWDAVVLLRGNNNAADAWSESYSVKNYIGRALTHLLRGVIRHSKERHGTNNSTLAWQESFFADDLSRMHVIPLRIELEQHTHKTRLTYLNLSQKNYQQRGP